MSHYNSTLQLDGINGMKELVTKHPDILEVNLSQLIGKLAELSVSIESVVRKSGLKLMEFIVSLATEDKVKNYLIFKLVEFANRKNLNIYIDYIR